MLFPDSGRKICFKFENILSIEYDIDQYFGDAEYGSALVLEEVKKYYQPSLLRGPREKFGFVPPRPCRYPKDDLPKALQDIQDIFANRYSFLETRLIILAANRPCVSPRRKPSFHQAVGLLPTRVSPTNGGLPYVTG